VIAGKRKDCPVPQEDDAGTAVHEKLEPQVGRGTKKKAG